MLILALDLATTTGWALHDGVDVTRSGVWRLPKAEPAIAYDRLRGQVIDGLCECKPDLLAYELVPGSIHKSGDAAHRYGGFEAVVLLECVASLTRYLGIPIATWKREAGVRTGTKDVHALKAARLRWPGVEFKTADEAVARWVAVAAARKVAARP